MIDSDLLDILNLAICYASNEYMKDKTAGFFRKVGEYHLEEAIKRGYVKIESQDKPLDVLENIARYLTSSSSASTPMRLSAANIMFVMKCEGCWPLLRISLDDLVTATPFISTTAS